GEDGAGGGVDGAVDAAPRRGGGGGLAGGRGHAAVGAGGGAGLAGLLRGGAQRASGAAGGAGVRARGLGGGPEDPRALRADLAAADARAERLAQRQRRVRDRGLRAALRRRALTAGG